MARVLFVEPFYGGSHRSFLDGLVDHSVHDFTLLTLEGREWRKRMRLGAQELAAEARSLPGSFDAVVASDMLDLATFLALTRPRFERTPVLAFFHENQFTYPRLKGTKLNSWFGQINYLSALAADRVAFNSRFHREDFLRALRTLEREPTNWLDATAIAAIEGKSGVLPVGVDLASLDAHRAEGHGGPPIILWNHRWEFDKAPATFVRAVEELEARGLEFRVAVAGERGDNPHPALETLPELLGERLVHFGRCETRAEYARLLWRSDIVVSTARHEFFGVATVEAMHCGCAPVAPNGLNYPELVPGELHGRCLYEDEGELVEKLAATIESRPAAEVLQAAVAGYAWEAVGPVWDAAIDSVVGSR